VNFGNESVPAQVLLDSGSATEFISEAFVQEHNIPTRPKNRPILARVADGREILNGMIDREVEIGLAIGDHQERLILNVTSLGQHQIILGAPWLTRHHPPTIDWKGRRIVAWSQYCYEHCLDMSSNSDSDSDSSESSLSELEDEFPSPDSSDILDTPAMDAAIAAITAVPSSEHLPSTSEQTTALPPEFADFIDVFSKAAANQLPPSRVHDHAIELLPGTSPPFSKTYSMSQPELLALKEYIDENLAKGFIRRSTSPAGAPVLFVKKKDGSLRLCVDYRGLNAITIPNRCPLPLISETLDRFIGATYFSKLDLRGAYHLVRIRAGDEWKTAFRTRYGHYEYLVMPFGLTNAPATFQQLINDVLGPFLDVYVVVYLDDILIFSASREEHVEHVRSVLSALRSAQLYAKLEKCTFFTDSTVFLGYIVSTSGIQMDPAKIQTILDWPQPQCTRDVQSFLGFANFYRRFIRNYSKLAAPLFRLVNGDFLWNNECQQVFDSLRSAFTSAPILVHFDPSRPCIVETDASDFVVAAILSQRDDNNVLHPVAFYSSKMSSAERNYDIHDKELLAVVKAFTEWRHYLEGSLHRVLVLTDHRNLEYFMTKRTLNRRQARWAEFLSRFQFQISFRPGQQGVKPDALTRRSGDRPPGGTDRQAQTVLHPHVFLAPVTIVPQDPDFLKRIKDALHKDPEATEIMQLLRSDRQSSDRFSLADYEINSDGLLMFQGLIYVPNETELQLSILKAYHDHPTAGHPGRAKTFELISRYYYWPAMRRFVIRYVANCAMCSRIKPVRHAPFGHLQSLEVPYRPWSDLSLDFIVGLPESENYNSILVVVDRMSKMAHFIGTRDTVNAEGLARLFRDNIWRLHGLPSSLVSDRGTVFTSQWWRALCRMLHISQGLSTAFHPQSDGQTERTNSTLETYLRAYVNYQQDDWAFWLAVAEFCYNNHQSASTTVSPFYFNYAYHPRLDFQTPIPANAEVTPHRTSRFVKRLQQLHDYLRAEILFAQDSQAEQYNKRHRPAPNFQVGQEVWLLRRHIRTNRPSAKLDYKKLGKFHILDKIGRNAYRLDLPPSMKVHPVFHVSLLEPVSSENAIPGHIQEPPPPVVVDDDLEYEVEAILDSRVRKRGGLQYLVKWVGYHDPTWQPEIDLVHSPELVAEFRARQKHDSISRGIRQKRNTNNH
jgi:hypothetical protein